MVNCSGININHLSEISQCQVCWIKHTALCLFVLLLFFWVIKSYLLVFFLSVIWMFLIGDYNSPEKLERLIICENKPQT